MNPFLQIFLAVGCLLSGMIGIAWAIRGRRVGDEPYCRKCGYDLRGLPASSTQCSECGADLSQRKAIRLGVRKVRRAGIVLAVITLLVGVIPAATAILQLRNTDWTRYKPTWWLRDDLANGTPTEKTLAHSELIKRIEQDRVWNSDLLKIAQMSPKPGRRGMLMTDELVIRAADAARRKQLMSDELWDQFNRQMLSLTLAVRPMVREGDPVAFHFTMMGEPTISGMNAKFAFGVQSMQIDHLEVDGKRPEEFQESRLAGGGSGRRSLEAYAAPTAVQWEMLTPGPHVLKCVVKLTSEVSSGSASPKFSWNEETTFTAQFEVLPADTQTTELAVDQTLRAEMSTVLKPIPSANTSAFLYILAARGKLPMPVAFDVYIIDGDQRVKAGSFHTVEDSSMGSSHTAFFLAEPPPGIHSGTYDVELRPNPGEAAKQVKLLRIWGESMFYTDLHPGTRRPPTTTQRAG